MKQSFKKNCILKVWLTIAFFPFFGISSWAASFSEFRFQQKINENIKALQMLTERAPGPHDEVLSDEELAEIVLKSEVRGSAFGLQSLALLYENYPEVRVRALMERIKEKSKEIEDLVGNYDKFQATNSETSARMAAKDLVQGLFGLGTKEKGFINKKGETPELTDLLERVKKSNWLPAKKDRAHALGALSDILENILKKRYFKMKVLEGGLHEFRRDLRWFGMGAAALGGLVQTSPGDGSQCDNLRGNLADPEFVEKFGQDFEKGFRKYSLDFSAVESGNSEPPKVCFISRCLYHEVTAVVGAFGTIKDGIEEEVIKSGGDKTPAAAATEANRIYRRLLDSKILSKLISELKACTDELVTH